MSGSRRVALPGAFRVADVALAFLVALLSVVGEELSLSEDAEDVRAAPWAGLLLLLVGSLVLAVRTSAPVAVLAVSAATSVWYQALGYRPLPLPLAVLLALYTVVLTRPLFGGGAAAVYVMAAVLASISSPLPLDDDHVFTYVVAVVATVTVGYGVELGRARATLAEQQSAQLVREQDGRTRAAVEQEQARIAREVHDIVAHDVSVIVAQARGARAVLDRDPPAAARALASIESVGREALDGLRRLMGLLRTAADEDGPPPQPRLDNLPWLVEQVRGAGLPVELSVHGEPRPLPATLELNAYRVVQEALTNSLKHAGPTRASVVLTYAEDSLLVEVGDEGPGPHRRQDAPGRTAGFGLISMRQRVAMHGGVLDAAAQNGTGFRVRARFPMVGEGP